MSPPSQTQTRTDPSSGDSRSRSSGPSSTPGPSLGPDDPIAIAPSPWTLKADVYLVPFWTSKAHAANLPAHTYSPLEAGSAYASPSAGGRPLGGLSMIQLLRYTESRVGPYDELILVPGSFEWAREGPDGKRKKARNPKITRIYVSQKHTCYNGRMNWNVPKHLAKFDWTTGADGSISVKVFPHDVPSSSSSYSASEDRPCTDPWFQATFKSIPYVPSFPLATRWADLIGFGTTLVQPPLPANPDASQGELPGTDRWCSVVPQQYSRHCSLGWVDLQQHPDGGPGGLDNFWPGLGRWHIGVGMRNAEIIFGEPEDVWEGPKSNL